MSGGGRPGSSEQEQLLALRAALQRADVSLDGLWLRYFALGGEAGPVEVEAYLHGLLPLAALERDILAHAANEWLGELTRPQPVPYTHTVQHPPAHQGPLAALVELLEGTHHAPPDRLPEILAAAGDALGVAILAYLVDYDQREMVPVTPAGEPGRPSLSVDATLAGWAFRLVQVLATSERLWVPLLDGVERLGVLEVTAADPAALQELTLQRHLRWLGNLLGHLVSSTTRYGDGLDRVRRRRPRSSAAELLWQLLPPLTAGTDAVTVAAALEPSYNVGGDAFDYAISSGVASLAILDAVGHGLSAGVLSASALGAYRSARRNGASLYDQARAIDHAIDALFLREAFVTGVLAQLDLVTGRVRYLAAGHPHPLLLRNGKVVRSLTEGRRLPFGLGAGELTIAAHTLEPGDWLVLYTDGVTEARDAAGGFFGEQRLVDFLEREAAAAHPPPETLRRLVHAVLAHQGGVLQDDASVVLAQWHPNAARTWRAPLGGDV